MSSLTNQTIDSTYDSLLKLYDNGDITGHVDANAVSISDGLGNTSCLYLSRTRLGIGEAAPNVPLEIKHTDTQLELSYSDSHKTEFKTDSGGNLFITCTGTYVRLNDDLRLNTNVIEDSSGTHTLTLAGGGITTGAIVSASLRTGSIIATDGTTIASTGTGVAQFRENIHFNIDGKMIMFGADGDATIEHVHNEGLRLISTTTNTGNLTYGLVLKSNLTGTPANGCGNALVFEQETANDNVEVGAFLASVCTDVSSGAEDFDIVVHAMSNGALSERFRIKDTGRVETLNGEFGKLGSATTFLSFNVVNDSTTILPNFSASAGAASSGAGSVKMSNSSTANSSGWVKIYVGGAAKYIPYWDNHAG